MMDMLICCVHHLGMSGCNGASCPGGHAECLGDLLEPWNCGSRILEWELWWWSCVWLVHGVYKGWLAEVENTCAVIRISYTTRIAKFGSVIPVHEHIFTPILLRIFLMCLAFFLPVHLSSWWFIPPPRTPREAMQWWHILCSAFQWVVQPFSFQSGHLSDSDTHLPGPIGMLHSIYTPYTVPLHGSLAVGHCGWYWCSKHY